LAAKTAGGADPAAFCPLTEVVDREVNPVDNFITLACRKNHRTAHKRSNRVKYRIKLRFSPCQHAGSSLIFVPAVSHDRQEKMRP
jgi:hypothetical protein